MQKIIWILFAVMPAMLVAACDNRPLNERLLDKLPEIKDASFDDREQRHLQKAIDLVRDGADPNVVFFDPAWDRTLTLLGLTISYGSLQQVSELLDLGADPNLPTDATDTHAPPLCHVSNKLEYKRGDAAEFVELMLDRGADVNGCPALGVAAAFAREDLVSLLLEKGAKLDEFVSEREYVFIGHGDFVNRPLQAAAFGGNVEILEKFLDLGVKAEQPEKLLLAAFESLSPDMMEKCLEVTSPRNLLDVYTGVLLAFHHSGDDYHWPRQMEMLQTMQRSGYGLTPEIFDAIQRRYPKHQIEDAILSVLQDTS